MKTNVPHLLCQRVGSLPLSEIARCMYGELKDPMRAARRLAGDLERAGLVTASTMLVSEAIVPPFLPVEDRAPGEEGTNFAQTAYFLRRRWDGKRRSEIFLTATKQATRRHGGRVGKIRNTDADHDYLLACVFLSLDGRDQARWRNSAWLEDRGWHFNGFVPDAILLGRTRSSSVIIEVGGKYPKQKLERRGRAARPWRRIMY